MRFVVDACVARAVSPSSETPAIECFDVLKALRETKSKVVYSVRIMAEYKKHQSPAFMGWYKSMTARKQVFDIAKTDEDKKISELRVVLGTIGASQDDEQISKDLHLFACALLTDKRVISLDKRILKRTRRVFADKSPFNDVLWSNPQTDKTSEWIKNSKER